MPNEISQDLRLYLEALLEEVFLEGEDFESRKKYLRRFATAEGLDAASLERDFQDLLDVLKDCRKQSGKSGERLARMLARECFISGEKVDQLLGGVKRSPEVSTEFIEPGRLMRNGQVLESVEENGRLIVPCRWKYAGSFHDGLACVEGDNGLHGYIDTKGNTVIPCQYESAVNFSEGFAYVRRRYGDPYYFIDRSGNTVLQIQDPDLRIEGGFHEGLFHVLNGRRESGFMDSSGRLVIPCKWHDASDFSDGLANVWDRDGNYCGCIDKTGKLVIPFLSQECLDFHEGLSTAVIDDVLCVIDKTGRKVFDMYESWDCCFQEGLISTTQGFADTTGELVIEDYSGRQGSGFSEGLAPTEEGPYIDHSGRVAIRGDWDCGDEFHDGLAVVEKDDKKGYVDRQGRMIVPYMWEYAHRFSDGLASVYDGSWFYFINREGKVLCRVRR